MANIPGRCWMDPDGKHVWIEHQCTNQRVARDKLPYGPNFWMAKDGRVNPSVVCTIEGCEFHDTPSIGEPPADWTP